MGDADLNPKKRAAGKEISRDNPGLDDDEETSEQEIGTFKRASDEVLAGRRIVKVRRQPASSTPSAPSSNPFAAVQLVPPTASPTAPAPVSVKEEGCKTDAENADKENDVSKEAGKEKEAEKDEKDKEPEKEEIGDEPNKLESADEKLAEDKAEDEVKEIADAQSNKGEEGKDTTGEKTENEEKTGNNNENVEKSGETSSFSSFQQLSSNQNAFTGLAGTGFSSSSFSFGPASTDGAPLGSGFASGSPFGLKSDQPSFGFGLSNNGNSSLFGTSGTSALSKNEGSKFPSMQEVPVETGEENEKTVFTADSVLYEFSEGTWKERGKGELKVNVSTTGSGKSRLVMRARGNYRLILNASLFPDMKLANMDKKGVTFACVNSGGEGKGGLSTFALKFKDVAIVEEFRGTVTEHKGKTAAALRTPENSPKASDD